MVSKNRDVSMPSKRLVFGGRSFQASLRTFQTSNLILTETLMTARDTQAIKYENKNKRK